MSIISVPEDPQSRRRRIIEAIHAWKGALQYSKDFHRHLEEASRPDLPAEPAEPIIHGGECGGVVVPDADYVINEDGDETYWNYRCTKCEETFITSEEAREDT